MHNCWWNWTDKQISIIRSLPKSLTTLINVCLFATDTVNGTSCFCQILLIFKCKKVFCVIHSLELFIIIYQITFEIVFEGWPTSSAFIFFINRSKIINILFPYRIHVWQFSHWICLNIYFLTFFCFCHHFPVFLTLPSFWISDMKRLKCYNKIPFSDELKNRTYTLNKEKNKILSNVFLMLNLFLLKSITIR